MAVSFIYTRSSFIYINQWTFVCEYFIRW